jgi:hypothetical protein
MYGRRPAWRLIVDCVLGLIQRILSFSAILALYGSFAGRNDGMNKL